MDMLVVVPVKPPVLLAGGTEGVAPAGWEGRMVRVVGAVGATGAGVAEETGLGAGAAPAGWAGGGVAGVVGAEAIGGGAVTDLPTGGSEAWGKDERGRGCWKEPAAFRLRSQKNSPPPTANMARIRATMPEEPDGGAVDDVPLEGFTAVFPASFEVEVSLAGGFDWGETAAGSWEAGEVLCFSVVLRLEPSTLRTATAGEVDRSSANRMAFWSSSAVTVVGTVNFCPG